MSEGSTGWIARMNACNAGDVLSELKRYVEDCVAERNTGRDDDLYEMPKDQQHPDAVVATGTIPWSLRHMSQIGDRSMWISFYRFDDVIQGNLSIGSGDRRQASAAVHWDAENDGRALKLEGEDAFLSVEDFARRFLEPFLFPELWLGD